LVHIPDRIGIAAAMVTTVVLNGIYYGAVRPLRTFLPQPGLEVVAGVLWELAAIFIGLLLVHVIRQLRLVSRLSALAANVDIFKPAPINAFSRLTAVSAIGILCLVALATLSTSELAPLYVAEEAFLIGLAIAAFLLPLRVMHGRLSREKFDLMDGSQDRLKLVLERLHAAVAANDVSNADQLNATLSSVLAEREVLAKLPTWPWSAGTFRGVATAVLLPIVLFVITRLLDRLF
ncbi:MAG TPA: hypothetical protein VM284_06875, partial [Candidatus Limnocylindria bacterium]|nr:hypothetical protein [Candidatus Limnocylindria bacterium]